MGQSKSEDAFKLALIRKEILTYCDGLPQIIRTHGSNSLGSVTLTVGKCFLWIGSLVDDYSLTQPLPGVPSLPRVTDLGEQMRVLGLEILYKPENGELTRTIETLRRQVELLNQLAAIQSKGMQ